MTADIAAIIGWAPDPVECTNGGFSHGPPPYTVDDLLAWLNEKLFHVSIEVYGDPGALPEAWDVYVNYKHVIEYGNEEDRHLNACAPTLLEAFERIVRDLDGAD